MKLNRRFVLFMLTSILLMGGVDAMAGVYKWSLDKSKQPVTTGKLDGGNVTVTITKNPSSSSSIGYWGAKNFNDQFDVLKMNSVPVVQITVPTKNKVYITVGIALKENYNYNYKNSRFKFDEMDSEPFETGDVTPTAYGQFREVTIAAEGKTSYTITKGNANEFGLRYIKVSDIPTTSISDHGNSPKLWETYSTDGIKVYLGGWKYQSNSELKDKYVRWTDDYVTKGEEEKNRFTDSWDGVSAKYSVGEEDPYKRCNSTKLITNAFTGYENYSYGADNARNEFTEGKYWGRYEFDADTQGEDGLYGGGRLKGNPFTVPCIGTFAKIEPAVNGRITLCVLQNSTIDYDADSSRGESSKGGNEDEKKSGTLESGASWRPVFIVDERGTRFGETDVKATTDTEHTIGRADKTALVYNSVDDRYQVYCVKLVDKNGDPIKGTEPEEEVYDGEVVKYYYTTEKVNGKTIKHGRTCYYEAKNSDKGLGQSDEKDAKYDYVYLTDSDKTNNKKTYVRRITFEESIKEEKPFVEGLKAKLAKDKFETFFSKSFPVYYKDGKEVPFGTEDAQIEMVEVWPEHVRGDGVETSNNKKMQRVWGPKYTGDGWLIISKGYVNYEFDVKAGKSYYFFSNDTKFGFCGYEFSPDEEQPTSTLILNENGTYIKGNESGSVGETKISGYAGEYASVTLERSFHKGWNAICLPFSVTESKMREWFGSEGKDIEDYELVTYNGAKLLIDEKDGDKYKGEEYEGKLRAHFFRHVYQDIVAGIPYMLYIPDKAKAANLGTGEYVTFKNITIEDDVKMKSFMTSADNMPVIDDSKINKNRDKNKKKDNQNYYLQAYGYDDLEYLYKKGDEDDYTSVGNYASVKPEVGSYLVLEKGIQLYETGNVTLPGFRSYLRPDYDPRSFSTLARIAATNFTRIIDEQEENWNAAVINDLLAEELGFFNRPANVYSVSGQLVRANSTSLVGLPKGVYIVNGKKFLVK